MDFDLTDEQRLIQDTVRAFVDERVLPNAVENDIAHKLDLGVIEGLAELGLLGIVVPGLPTVPFVLLSAFAAARSPLATTARAATRSTP